MQNSSKSLEIIEKYGSVRMRSIYRAQKLTGENFLPLMSASAKAASNSMNEEEVAHVS